MKGNSTYLLIGSFKVIKEGNKCEYLSGIIYLRSVVMIIQKVILLTKRLEDKNNPLMGPVLKSLYLFGLWQTESRLRNMLYNLLHTFSVMTLICQVIDLCMIRQNIHLVLSNVAITALNFMSIVKLLSSLLRQKYWKQLVKEIAEAEFRCINQQDPSVLELVASYTKYSRAVTYTYWTLCFITHTAFATAPHLKLLTNSSYRADVKNGVQPWPQLVGSWLPFDNTKLPGYPFGIAIHLSMATQCTCSLASFDATTIAIMNYLQGHMKILKMKCQNIFKDADNCSRAEILKRIRECHHDHFVLIKHYHMLKSLLSPIMFAYVLVCSVGIGCNLIQYNLSGVTTSQKLWVIQYTVGLTGQLFLYCWHSNEVTEESYGLDGGVYSSDWWQADVIIRRQLLLLGRQLMYRFQLDAGPFAELSVPTFIKIMKASYSLITLVSQLNND